MSLPYHEIIARAYQAFNDRDIDTLLSLMQPQVEWPNGWEGGYVQGHAAVQDYWTRQWQEINPKVEPLSIQQLPGGSVAVAAQQTVSDLQGKVLFTGTVNHIYTFREGKIAHMEIREPPSKP